MTKKSLNSRNKLNKVVQAPVEKLTTSLKEMLDMPLHAEEGNDSFRIKRVPGGWLYSRIHPNAGVHSVFVSE